MDIEKEFKELYDEMTLEIKEEKHQQRLEKVLNKFEKCGYYYEYWLGTKQSKTRYNHCIKIIYQENIFKITSYYVTRIISLETVESLLKDLEGNK